MALKGIKVIELAGLAPVPFCGMILADFGASVIRVDKLPLGMDVDCLGNGKRSLLLNLKSTDGVDVLKKLAKNADVIIEPFRPGVMEKLGLGPDAMLKENKSLIYARLSGYGQTGPLSQRAGHDINYLAQSGMLSVIGGTQRLPFPPVNFAADFAGGGLQCAFGILMALFERSKSGLGQVIDANMTSGVAYVGSWLLRSKPLPFVWTGKRGTNLLDGGSHFYGCYETKDGKFMAVGAIEPQFYDLFMQGLGLDADQLPQMTEDLNKAKTQIQDIFKMHTQQHWIDVFKDIDACVTPVLEVEEAAAVNKEGFIHCGENAYAPKPAPGLSRTPAKSQSTKPKIEAGEHTLEILKEAGYSPKDIDQLIRKGVVASSSKL